MVRVRPNLSNVRALGTKVGVGKGIDAYFKSQEALAALKAQQDFTLSRDAAGHAFTSKENEKTMAFNREKFQEETRQFGIKNAVEMRKTLYAEATVLAKDPNMRLGDIDNFVMQSDVKLEPWRMKSLYALNRSAGTNKLEKRIEHMKDVAIDPQVSFMFDFITKKNWTSPQLRTALTTYFGAPVTPSDTFETFRKKLFSIQKSKWLKHNHKAMVDSVGPERMKNTEGINSDFQHIRIRNKTGVKNWYQGEKGITPSETINLIKTSLEDTYKQMLADPEFMKRYNTDSDFQARVLGKISSFLDTAGSHYSSNRSEGTKRREIRSQLAKVLEVYMPELNKVYWTVKQQTNI